MWSCSFQVKHDTKSIIKKNSPFQGRITLVENIVIVRRNSGALLSILNNTPLFEDFCFSTFGDLLATNFCISHKTKSFSRTYTCITFVETILAVGKTPGAQLHMLNKTPETFEGFCNFKDMIATNTKTRWLIYLYL